MKKSNTPYNWPPEEEVKKMRELLSDPSRDPDLIVPAGNAPESEKLKFALSQVITRYLLDHKLRQKDLARKLEIDEARISEIIRGRLDGFTIDRLLGYAQKLVPSIRVTVRAA